MKKKIIMGIALAALVAGADLSWAAGLTFSRIKPPKSTMKPIEWNNDGRVALKDAIKVHNLIRAIKNLKDLEKQLSVTSQMKELEEMRLAAMEKCSINKLGEQFKNPKEVWDKMNEEYAKRSKELTIYVDSATPTEAEEQAFKNYLETGEMTPEMMEERYAPWRIGQEILTDVYQNQDKWGERKDVKAPSFPLWKDQKYVFDQEWNDYYTKLNAYFGVPPQGRPIIGEEKYDYAKYEDVKKAHQVYVTALAAKNPAKAAILATDFKNPPQAPKPLPPKNEMTLYLGTGKPEANVYPALPEPWQKYAKDGFKNIDPKGEMAADFQKGLVLKEEAKNEMHANRLSAYAEHKQAVESTTIMENLGSFNGGRTLGKIYNKLGKYMDVIPGVNLLEEDSRKLVLSKLEAKKKELLAKAEKDLAERPEDKTNIVRTGSFGKTDKTGKKEAAISVYERDENVIKALKKDTEARVYITEVNAGEIDQLLKKEENKYVPFEGDDQLEKILAIKASIEIDDTCLNGGI